MANIQPGPSRALQGPLIQSQILNKPTYGVYCKKGWSDPNWIYVPFLYPVTASQNMLGSESRATFIYDYGQIKERVSTSYEVFDPLRVLLYNQLQGIRDLFVCIKIFPNQPGIRSSVIWVGVIPSEQIQIAGTRPSAVTYIPLAAGQQVFTGFGLEYLLSRRRVVGALVLDERPLVSAIGQVAGSSPPVAHIGWSPTFNQKGKHGRRQYGNRSPVRVAVDGNEASYVFTKADETDGGNTWSFNDMIEYLLYWSHSPFWTSEPSFTLGSPSILDSLYEPETNVLRFLDQLDDVVEQEGHDVLSIINKMIDRRRGITASIDLEYEGNHGFPISGSKVNVRIHSMAEDIIDFGNATLPKNVHQGAINLDSGLDVQSAVLSLNSLSKYDRVVVQGERTVVCFSATTISDKIDLSNSAVLIPGWTAEDATAYKDSSDVGRRSQVFDRVFRVFRLGSAEGSKSFDWKTKNGGASINPTFDNEARIDPLLLEVGPFWNAQKPLLHDLPLLNREDIAFGSNEFRFIRTFAVIQVLDALGSALFWVFAHNPPTPDEAAASIPGGQFTVDVAGSVEPFDRDLSIAVRFTPNHIMARTHFSVEPPPVPPDEPRDAPSTHTPVFDYDRMIVTVAIETDTRPTIEIFPTANQGSYLDRTLLIQVPDCHVHVRAGSLVIGLSPTGTLVFHDGPPVIRDDTDLLRRVAAMAQAWYGKDRATIEITYKGLRNEYQLGMMVRSVQQHQFVNPTNTVVTERSWDFQALTSTITTGHAELEFV